MSSRSNDGNVPVVLQPKSFVYRAGQNVAAIGDRAITRAWRAVVASDSLSYLVCAPAAQRINKKLKTEDTNELEAGA